MVLLLAGCSGGGGSSGSSGGVVTPVPTPTPTSSTAATVTLTVASATIAPGASTTLSWTSSAGATGCTASGGAGFSGAQPASGSVTVNPAATTNFTLSCTFGSSVVAGSAVVTVQGPPPAAGAAAAFANPDNGGIPDRALHPLAFPTAIGFGRSTSVRATNAVVYKINTLDDVADPNDGKISYRECALALAVSTPYAIPAGRPRYCVFDVAGAIILQSPARITTPKIYIAGQTSPGGIEFRLGANYNPVDSLIDTRRGGDHMILRHVRARLGEHPGRSSDNGDPIRLQETSFQIIDHVSSMFGTDESLDTACSNCTIQWSIIGPNICLNAGHSSSLHCKTFFLKPANNVTIAHNLTQHGDQRGINIAPGNNPPAAGNTGQADIFNNVVYDFISESGLISNQFGSVYANYIGNVNLRGPRYNASDGNYLMALYTPGGASSFGFDIYARDNVTPRTRIAGQFGATVTDPFVNAAGFIDHVVPSTICGVTPAGVADCSRNGLGVVQNSSYALAPGRSLTFDPAKITSPEQALRDVMAYAGADLCRDGPCRDNVDALYIDDLRTCDSSPWLFASTWASTVAGAGGWANLTQGGAKPDADNDGMPDDWERRFTNTNPNVWDANADADGDGYPNIEEYLNALAQDDVRYSGFVGSGTGRVPAYNCGRAMY
ncbi:hypothetical protein [Sphingomonas sp. MS122]|uniref:hypothetical protein n=1 Tax=Sphingomonas sp. MS122 TaxID=3412683 RepID=UPI003C2B2620